jgi:hypothetical protein
MAVKAENFVRGSEKRAYRNQRGGLHPEGKTSRGCHWLTVRNYIRTRKLQEPAS